MIAGLPRSPVAVPRTVDRLAGARAGSGAAVRAVWENEAGGTTFEITGDAGRCFVKWAPAGTPLDLAAEAERLAWAAQYLRVPHPLEVGRDASGSWLVTSPLVGVSAVDARRPAGPRTAVIAVGEGLRALHDTLPVASCPFSWSAEERVTAARHRADQGLQDPAGWHPDHRHLTVEAALELLDDVPAVNGPVVCHGDSCAPNTVLDDDGRWSGHVDLGSLGVADRWADLAVATWSTVWNYGPGWESLLLDAYGISADPERTRFYRLLWDLDE
jgi:kanamycin kinase